MDLMPNDDQPNVITSKVFLSKRIKILIALVLILSLLSISFVLTKRFLPKSAPSSSPAPVPTSNKITLPCPSTPQFCQQAKEMIENGQIKGIGASVEKNSPLVAVFDGKALTRSYTIAKIGTFTHISLTSTKNDLTAIYYLSKTPSKEGLIKKGEIIATATNSGVLMFLLLDKNHQPIPKSGIIFEKGK